MDKKKIILIVILFVIALVLGGLLVNKKLNSNNKEEIVQSNARDENLEQLEVTNDTINIRMEADTKSEKVGKVSKGEIYTILETKEDNYYIWYKIKTSNDIEGFIAGKYKPEEGQVEEYIKLLDKEDNLETSE
ncbi:MAG: SH3 domain-containing protein [Bacilli bacterium]|nr:SH3 domain-containing protein [Bacilli bacterium]